MKPGIFITAALLALGLTTAASATQIVYQVTVNTGSSSNTGGLDFQFNPSGGAAAGTATLTNFTTDNIGSLTPPPELTGGASGSLPGTVTLTNSTGYNDYFENFTYGNTLSFLVTLSGAALSPPAGTTGSSTFAFSLYDQSGNPQLTNDPDGSIADITVNFDGTTTPQTFQTATGGNSLATVTLASAPEPSQPAILAMVGAGLVGLIVLKRRSHRA